MVNAWDFLSVHKGKFFKGEWPTLPQLFEITADTHPQNNCFTAFSPDRVSWTYEEALAIVRKVAGWLVSEGVKKGDRVAMSGKNSPEWAFSYLAALYAGAVVVPIDHQLNVDETCGLIKHSGAKVLFIDEEKFDSIVEKKLKLKAVVSLSDKHETYILNLKAESLVATLSIEEEDLAALLYTSGTTGVAKGVMLTHKNFVADCFLSSNYMTLYPTDVFYALLPIHHSYTMLAVFIESLSVGAELVFGKRLALPSIMNDLGKGGITMFLGVPVLYNKLIRGILKKIREKGIIPYAIVRTMMFYSGLVKKYFNKNIGKRLFKGILSKASLDKIRICISGGGPLPASTFKYYNQLGLNFVQGYGLTETSPILTLNPVYAYKEASVGKVLPRVDMKILNPDSEGRGEILVKGPMVMKGYFENEEATKAAFTADGYFKTGDMGYLDKDQYLFLTGRAKSLIVTQGGKNVFPEEIENKFQLFDEIEQILVRGYEKDAKLKIEGIEVVFYPADAIRGEGMNTETLQAHFEGIVKEVNKDLLSYKRIERVHVLSQPMEMTSKRTIKRHKVVI